MGFWRADFDLFGRLVQRVPWETVLKGRGVQEDWTVFRKEILKVRELTLCVLKDELVGMKMSLADWGALIGTQDKKESL